MSRAPIRKVVFPVGGLGTRFLPATKSMPKEMLPVVDKPLIHYAFEEARAAGIEQFIFVTGRNKHGIEDHFDHVYELQSHLSTKNKRRELELTSDWLPSPGNVSFTRQQEPLGLGHAVWCARHLIGDEPFAVILADDMVQSKTPCLKQMVNAYHEVGGNIVAVMDIPRSETKSYGIVDIDKSARTRDKRLVKAKGLVEKPAPDEAPSTLSIIGRYILQPEIFDILGRQERGAIGEIQLTDAISTMIGKQNVYGYRFEGTRYDCGGLVGFVAANVAWALGRKDIHDKMLDELKRIPALDTRMSGMYKKPGQRYSAGME
ncbi:MAG: UTP--glucose-1-phosphate uridylyltransferase GalU [Pseudomonadota bacterium]|nr:UTP--glucose-1-phosphate uridylyltransferase GalU [Pseudomonadota bacterium]MDE3037189.1 UTP--glucose-1-phosphate uridylyltransferase GalU [Pseudomonadota bacterium]